MRASILLSLLPFSTATIVTSYSAGSCTGTNLGTFSSCGVTGLRNFDVRSARVNFEQATVRFYRDYVNGGCAGAFVSVAR